MNGKRCGDCKYFVAFRNMNYKTCTCDTITEYCELLQNEDTYDRDKGDEIWNGVFDDCPLNKGYVSTVSAIRLLQSKKEVRKQFDDYVRISCEKKKELQDENEQLRHEIEIEKKWQLEKDKYYVKIKEENDRIKTKGLDVLAFYESKLKDVVGTEDFQCVRDEIWIVRQVLYEMGVIDDE